MLPRAQKEVSAEAQDREGLAGCSSAGKLGGEELSGLDQGQQGVTSKHWYFTFPQEKGFFKNGVSLSYSTRNLFLLLDGL